MIFFFEVLTVKSREKLLYFRLFHGSIITAVIFCFWLSSSLIDLKANETLILVTSRR